MSPQDAADTYFALLAINEKEAVCFAMEYEGELCGSEEEYDEYLALVLKDD